MSNEDSSRTRDLLESTKESSRDLREAVDELGSNIDDRVDRLRNPEKYSESESGVSRRDVLTYGGGGALLGGLLVGSGAALASDDGHREVLDTYDDEFTDTETVSNIANEYRIFGDSEVGDTQELREFGVYMHHEIQERPGREHSLKFDDSNNRIDFVSEGSVLRNSKTFDQSTYDFALESAYNVDSE